MSFNIDALTTYVENNSKEIALASVAGAQTAKLLIGAGSVQFGKPGEHYLLGMSNDVVIQENTGCARNPLGSTTLSQKKIKITALKSENNYCSKDLWATVYAKYLKQGQAPKEEFSEEIVREILDDRAAILANQNEEALWQGDVTITGTSHLNKFDGILKVSTGTTITVTGSTLVEKLQDMFLQVPVEVRTKPDFRFFIGSDLKARYDVALANLNLFRDADDMRIFGTSGSFSVVDGLNGTDIVYAARISNIVIGMDMQGDEDKVEFTYDNASKEYFHDVYYTLGVQVRIDAETFRADLS